MPLHWMIDSRLRTVEVTAEGDVTLAQAMAFFDAIEGAGALAYSKLLDGIRGRAAMTPDEVIAVAVRIRAQHGLSHMGALAIVVSPEQAEKFIRVIGAAAVADRPLKVFDDVRPARRWLMAQAPRRP